jgi:tRNA A-37 threonylcarbamoyl transferase component Bud32
MRSDVPTGTILAGFRIESLIGEGAMGSVYLAEASGGQRVALKVLSPELARDDRFRQRFLRESQLAASLDHPHIVPTIASGEDQGLLYLAMPYVAGSDLRELLRREGRLEPERTLALLTQVADALDAAHAAGLVHRDVKPGNILVSTAPEGEQAFICDFGLARHVTSVSSLTGDRGFVGTIDYVPPEQIEGSQIDSRADIYSLGCVLYECLAGERPFERESELAVVFAHLNEQPPRISDLRPGLPLEFDTVFETALAKSPDSRYSTCGELIAAAQAALKGRTFVRRKPRRRRLLLAGVALLAAAGAAIGGVLASQDSNAPATITQTRIAGATLDLKDSAYRRIWKAAGALLPLKFPEHYARHEFPTRKTAVYFASDNVQGAILPGHVRAVEVTTWNRSDRTAEGVGPCSTVEELKRAYGARLKPAPANTLGHNVYGYTVGKNLFFAIAAPPHPRFVGAVAVYSNRVDYAGFNAISDPPCT